MRTSIYKYVRGWGGEEREIEEGKCERRRKIRRKTKGDNPLTIVLLTRPVSLHEDRGNKRREKGKKREGGEEEEVERKGREKGKGVKKGRQ
jgi:hypothetical protein